MRCDLERGIDFGKRAFVGESGIVKRYKLLEVESEKTLVETGVGKKCFEGGFVYLRAKRYSVCGRVKGFEDKSGFDEKFKRIADCGGFRLPVDMCRNEFAA
jgi:hypothetical protein